jgi:hypothetical protein
VPHTPDLVTWEEIPKKKAMNLVQAKQYTANLKVLVKWGGHFETCTNHLCFSF